MELVRRNDFLLKRRRSKNEHARESVYHNLNLIFFRLFVSLPFLLIRLSQYCYIQGVLKAEHMHFCYSHITV